MASICFFSSSVRYFSASFFSHSAGISASGAVAEHFEPLEHVAEHAVELVEIALVLHQRGARQIVEILDPARGEIGLHRLHQREVFAQRHRHAGGFELVEEGDEHIVRIAALWTMAPDPVRTISGCGMEKLDGSYHATGRRHGGDG